MSKLLKFGKHGRVLLSEIIAVDGNDSDNSFLEKFGMFVEGENDSSEVILYIRGGKKIRYTVARDQLDDEILRVHSLLGWV